MLVISPLRILVIDDDISIRRVLAICLETDGHSIVTHGTMSEGLAALSRQPFDLIYLDIRLGMQDGLDFIPQLREISPWSKIVVITAFATVSTAVTAMKRGAIDYLPKPFTAAQALLVTQKVAGVVRMERKIDALQRTLGELDPEANFATASPKMESALQLARQVATSNATVLLCGEVGTGKGRLARAIHTWSARGEHSPGSLLCQGKPAEALDLELFGAAARDPGAGDGPAQELQGKIDLCEGGTLILEEVAEIPPSLQPKISHLLTNKEYERQNDFRPRRANVRIVATSSADLPAAVHQQRLRAELLLALDVVRIDLPPLRERPEDIGLLARRYLAFFARENHRRIFDFTADAMRVLSHYHWPGNTRELRNIVERAVLLCTGEEITPGYFPPNLLRGDTTCGLGDLVPLEMIEQVHARKVIDSVGSIKGAATILDVNEKTLRRWLKREPHATISIAPLMIPESEPGE